MTQNKYPKYTPNPLIADLPDYLKDPANYEKIQRQLLDALASTHSHSDMEEWSACLDCQKRMMEHANLMRKLGFKKPGQYLAWKKVHETIAGRISLPKYNS